MGSHRKENAAFYYLITSLNVRGFHYLIKCFPGVGKGGLEEILLTFLVSNFVSFQTKIFAPPFYLLLKKLLSRSGSFSRPFCVVLILICFKNYFP